MKLPFFLASKFVAAETLEATLPVAADLRSQGLRTTLDLLGEYISDPTLATAAKNSYIQLVRNLQEADGAIDKNISIKLSMLGQKIDESFCLDNVHELLRVAKETGTFVRLDMEGTDVTESTISILEKVYPEYPENVGIVLQAYLKRTAEDIERVCALGARVRLCKGAYKEPAKLAYQDMPTIREQFLEHMDTLITKGKFPAIATHDDILIDATRSYVKTNNVSPDTFEFQMLYGIRADTQKAIAEEGYGIRVYVPFGDMWLPYYSRRLRERKENVWFILKNMFKK
ncbi:MAG: proline dehydrogenase family protein [Rhodothermales bacterium]|nr:proline dehydrogenase family protein [Rhodothermales bacterium]MDG2015494.1 proline dehydrogenase family protein [Rhodothermales bacterium]